MSGRALLAIELQWMFLKMCEFSGTLSWCTLYSALHCPFLQRSVHCLTNYKRKPLTKLTRIKRHKGKPASFTYATQRKPCLGSYLLTRSTACLDLISHTFCMKYKKNIENWRGQKSKTGKYLLLKLPIISDYSNCCLIIQKSKNH